jgi:hypothetical protein
MVASVTTSRSISFVSSLVYTLRSLTNRNLCTRTLGRPEHCFYCSVKSPVVAVALGVVGEQLVSPFPFSNGNRRNPPSVIHDSCNLPTEVTSLGVAQYLLRRLVSVRGIFQRPTKNKQKVKMFFKSSVRCPNLGLFNHILKLPDKSNSVIWLP